MVNGTDIIIIDKGSFIASGFHGYNRPIKRVQWLKETRDSVQGTDLFMAKDP